MTWVEKKSVWKVAAARGHSRLMVAEEDMSVVPIVALKKILSFICETSKASSQHLTYSQFHMVMNKDEAFNFNTW